MYGIVLPYSMESMESMEHSFGYDGRQTDLLSFIPYHIPPQSQSHRLNSQNNGQSRLVLKNLFFSSCRVPVPIDRSVRCRLTAQKKPPMAPSLQINTYIPPALNRLLAPAPVDFAMRKHSSPWPWPRPDLAQFISGERVCERVRRMEEEEPGANQRGQASLIVSTKLSGTPSGVG